jgi:hypothetical protein
MMYDSNEEIEASTRGKWITKNIFPCDNVDVPTSVDEPFWVVLVDKGLHVVVASFKYANGNEWMQGNLVVYGFWYKQLFTRSRSYTLCDDQPTAFVFSHLILASKSFMPPTAHVVNGKLCHI